MSLGANLVNLGRLGEAEAEYRAAIDLEPDEIQGAAEGSNSCWITHGVPRECDSRSRPSSSARSRPPSRRTPCCRRHYLANGDVDEGVREYDSRGRTGGSPGMRVPPGLPEAVRTLSRFRRAWSQ